MQIGNQMQNHKIETNSEHIYEDGSIWSTLIFIKIIGSDTLWFPLPPSEVLWWPVFICPWSRSWHWLIVVDTCIKWYENLAKDVKVLLNNKFTDWLWSVTLSFACDLGIVTRVIYMTNYLEILDTCAYCSNMKIWQGFESCPETNFPFDPGLWPWPLTYKPWLYRWHTFLL